MKLSLQLQRRRVTRAGPSISLFPFLAVLICTMGALVPLLLAISRTARLQAEAAAQAKATEQAAQHGEELQTQREDIKWRVEQLKHSRQQTQSQLADARLELGHFEDHARRLRGQIAQSETAMANLDRVEQAGGQQTAQADAELRQLRERIEGAKRQLDDARRVAAGRPRSFAVVPYEGPNQTRRRPIYVECLADAVVLQPEGIRLGDADFEGPLGPDNPLAAALRAAREHMLAGRDFDAKVGEPYPMLLVRPEGIAAFYAARAAMKSWGGDFGYELIGADWKLAYQAPDPRLADVYRQVIVAGRASEARLAAAAPRHYGRGRSGGARQQREDGSGASGDDFAGGDGTGGGAGGDGQGLGEPGRGGSAGGGSGGSVASASGGYGGQGASVGGGPALGTSASNANRGPSASASGGTGYGGQGVAGGGGGSGAPGGASTPGGWPAGEPGNGSSVSSGGIAGSSGGSAGGGSGSSTAMAGGSGMSSVGSAEAAITGAPGGAQRSYGSVAGNSGGYGAASAAPSGAYGSSAGSSWDAAPGGGGAKSTGTERPDGYVVQPPREQASDPSRGRDSTDQVTRGRSLRPGEWEPTPDLPPERKDNDEFARGKQKKNVVDRRGEDWGLRNAGHGSVALTRPIRVECYADRLVVISDRGAANNRVVPLGARADASINTFISAIWEQMDGWGIAGRGMYWRPVLQITVAPDAQHRFAEMSRVLEGSGLTVERR